MPFVLSEAEQAKLKLWIESSLATNSHSLASGYQGQALIYRDAEKERHELRQQ